jgi:hypothetical protein
MTDKYKYMIFPDRTYVLTYEDMTYEVKGQDILDQYYREAHLMEAMKEWIMSDEDELSTANQDLSTDEDHLDIGEL